MKNRELSNTNYEIREIKEKDIDNGGLLEIYRENFPLGELRKEAAKAILKEIKTNPLHKIFVAVTNDKHNWSLVRQLCLLNQNSYSGVVR